MNYKTLSKAELIRAWEEKRSQIKRVSNNGADMSTILKEHPDITVEDFTELLEMRKEIDRREGTPAPKTIDFEQYLTD